MRTELNHDLVIGDVSVAQAIDWVEEEVARWSCSNYVHITRAMSVDRLQIIELETIFSKPTKEKPVPIAVVCVEFHLDTKTGDLTYQFEQENVKHKVGGQSLARGKFEHWLDRIIGDKLQVRQLHDLATPFEETRLAPPPLPSEPGSDIEGEDEADDEAKKGQQAVPVLPRRSNELQIETKLPMSTLLASIFDAADEEDEFELTHKEVADLLYATPLGLADWDIKLLLTTAHELATGKIEYKPFVQTAPEIIEALLSRRAAYEARQQPNLMVTHEAIELCYGEEIEEVARAAREAFAAVDASGKCTLSRSEFKSCLASRSERFSLQEVQLLMQMCKEDDFGQVPYDDFSMLLQQLRIDSLHNALVETDVSLLRVHLIILLRHEGMHHDCVLPVWNLRNVLLSADQLCLSRMQIHVILSIVHPNENGEVDAEYFLRVACTVIPYMFDVATFMEKAGTIAKEKADALAKAELEELQGITSSIATKRRVDDEEQDDVQANAPDRDAVEKALIHIAGQYDEKHRQVQTIHARKFLEAMHHEQVAQCQLWDSELRGFIAEAEIDERGEIAYVEHIKMWVPVIFELRKSRVYDAILAKDWGLNAPHLADLSEYEANFPLRNLLEEPQGDSGMTGRTSSQRRPSWRHSRSGTASDLDGLQRSSLSRNADHKHTSRRPNSRGRRERSESRERRSGQGGRQQRPESQDRRPGSRAGSQRSVTRTNSTSSVDSMASRRSFKG